MAKLESVRRVWARDGPGELTTSFAFFLSLWKSAKSTSRRSAMEVALFKSHAVNRGQRSEICEGAVTSEMDGPLCSSGVGRDDDAVLDVNVGPNVVDHRRLSIQLEGHPARGTRGGFESAVGSSGRRPTRAREISEAGMGAELTLKEQEESEVSLCCCFLCCSWKGDARTCRPGRRRSPGSGRRGGPCSVRREGEGDVMSSRLARRASFVCSSPRCKCRHVSRVVYLR